MQLIQDIIMYIFVPIFRDEKFLTVHVPIPAILLNRFPKYLRAGQITVIDVCFFLHIVYGELLIAWNEVCFGGFEIRIKVDVPDYDLNCKHLVFESIVGGHYQLCLPIACLHNSVETSIPVTE